LITSSFTSSSDIFIRLLFILSSSIFAFHGLYFSCQGILARLI
jgi:hypothetical protein